MEEKGGFRKGKLGMHLTEFFPNPKGLTDLALLEELKKAAKKGLEALSKSVLKQAKQFGFSDIQLGEIFSVNETQIRERRKKIGVIPTYKLVDTCSAEFEAYTPYYYSTYEDEDEVSLRRAVGNSGGCGSVRDRRLQQED